MNAYIIILILPTILVLTISTIAYRSYIKIGTDKPKSTLFAISIFSILGAWLLLSKTLADSNFFFDWTATPPRILFLPLTCLLTLIILNRFSKFKELILSIPLWLPILIQSFRILVEASLWQLHRDGLIPIQMTFDGRNFDIFIGVTAPVLAFLVFRKMISSSVILVWNFVGLGLLINVMGTAATSIPGRLHLDWPGEPLTLIGGFPYVWIPGFLAPFAVALHVISIRQNFIFRINRLDQAANKKSLFERIHDV